MSQLRKRLAIALAGAVAAAILPAVAVAQSAAIPSTEEIVQRLTKPPSQTAVTMRGITVIKPSGGAQSSAAAKPNIDLAINFEFNSAQLSPDGELILDNLGRALQDPQLKGSRFAIAGHTDAVGTAAYNKALSAKRAEAVKRYLVDHYGLEGEHLSVAGFGLTRLLDPDNPTSAVNRRVEITNLGKAQ